jgi:hypothetical protein
MADTYTSAREAALANPPAAASPEITPVLWVDVNGVALPASESSSVNESADNLKAFRGTERESAALSISADFAEAIDAMRADAASYQIDEVPGVPNLPTLPKPVALPAQPAQPAVALDQALAVPEIRAAVESELNATAQVRNAYGAGLQNAMACSQAALLEIAPSLMTVPLDQFQNAMSVLQRANPAQYLAVVNLLDRVGRIQAALFAEEAHTAHGRAEWVKAEDAKFERATRMTPEVKQEVAAELFAYGEELGVGREQLVHLMRTEAVLQSSVFQHVLLTAVQARLSQKKAVQWRSRGKQVPPVPPVVKPGVSVSRSERSAADLQSLSGALSKSGSLKDAAALLVASRKSRN